MALVGAECSPGLLVQQRGRDEGKGEIEEREEEGESGKKGK